MKYQRQKYNDEPWSKFLKFAAKLSAVIGIVMGFFFSTIAGLHGIFLALPLFIVVFLLIIISRAIVESVEWAYGLYKRRRSI